jgi:death-on-curing family protein
MDIEFLTVDVIIDIHQEQISKTPGEPTAVHSMDRLESAALAPQHTYLYDEDCTIHTLAAKYVWHLVKAHAFMAGNKRAGMAAGVTFLRLNGYDWNLSDESYGKFINRVIARDANFDELVNFLETHSRQI